MKTIFKKIIDREIEATLLFENERIIAIADKYPVAPVHILLLPKKEISSLQEMQEEDFPLLGEIIKTAQSLAREHHIENNYRLLTNIGREGGQTIFHLHFHLIGGRKLGAMG